eukprot:2661544-Amphidinium_carterae.1
MERSAQLAAKQNTCREHSRTDPYYINVMQSCLRHSGMIIVCSCLQHNRGTKITPVYANHEPFTIIWT